jgi:hypothetical protein
MQILHGLTSAGLIELAHAGRGTGVLGAASPPATSSGPRRALIGEGPRPFYDLVGGPGPEIESDGSEYFLKSAAEEAQAAEEPSAQAAGAPGPGMGAEVEQEELADPNYSRPSPESAAATASDSEAAGSPRAEGVGAGELEGASSPGAEVADPLEPLLEEAEGWPEGPSSGAIADWFSDSETTFEGFDLPAPGELTLTEEPVQGSVPEALDGDEQDDLAPAENDFDDEVAARDSAPAETNGLLTSAPTGEAEALLGSAEDIGEPPPEETLRKRVEDDERVTKGLINRLIEGLKGL